MDDAYLGEVFLGLIFILMGLVFGLTWVVVARREGRGFAVGAISGIAVAAVIIVVGVTRTLVRPALTVVELLVLTAGAAAPVVMSRTRTEP